MSTEQRSQWAEQQLAQAREHRQQLVESIGGALAEIELADRVIEALSGERPPAPLGTAPALPPSLAPLPPSPPLPSPPPTAEQPEPEPEPPAAEPPTEGEREQAVIEYLQEHGPSLRVEICRALGIPDGSWRRLGPRLQEPPHNLVMATVPSEVSWRGVTMVALPGQQIPERDPRDVPGTPPAPAPAPARRPTEPKYTLEQMDAAMAELGIFTVKRLAERVGAKSGGGTIHGHVQRAQASGLLRRFGGDRGPNVFYAHRDYDGPLTVDAARAGVPLRATEAPAAPPTPPKRTVTNVGAEGMPPHLQRMPVATANIPVKSRVAAAELQLQALRYVGAGFGAAAIIAQQVAGTPDNEQPPPPISGRFGRVLRDLHAHDLVRRAGTEYGPWQQPRGGSMGGRPGVRYQLTPLGREVVAEVVQEHAEVLPPLALAPSAQPVAPPEQAPPPGAAALTLEMVRDAARSMEGRGQFSPTQVAAAIAESQDTAAEAVPLDAVQAHLGSLAERGVLRDESPTPDMPLFEYRRPDGPGKAAEIDQARAAAQQEPVPPRGDGAPVPGTGRPERAPGADVDALLRAARKAGGTVERTGGDHFLVVMPGNRRAVIAGTPSSGGLQRDRLKLRSIGVQI